MVETLEDAGEPKIEGNREMSSPGPGKVTKVVSP